MTTTTNTPTLTGRDAHRLAKAEKRIIAADRAYKKVVAELGDTSENHVKKVYATEEGFAEALIDAAPMVAEGRTHETIYKEPSPVEQLVQTLYETMQGLAFAKAVMRP